MRHRSIKQYAIVYGGNRVGYVRHRSMLQAVKEIKQLIYRGDVLGVAEITNDEVTDIVPINGLI